ncbi:hypothetical protein V2J09_016851 [Rumex salicifolius]
MSATAPKWLFPLLEAKFRVGKIGSYNVFCITCMGHAIRETEKSGHPDHEFLQAVKASQHYAVRVSDMIKRLHCQEIAKFSVNSKQIFFLNSRVESKSGSRTSNESESSKKTCVNCSWRLVDGNANSLYCSLGCKFKKRDGILRNPSKGEDLIDEELPKVDLDQEATSGGKNGIKEELKTKITTSFRKRSRKGIPIRSPFC